MKKINISIFHKKSGFICKKIKNRSKYSLGLNRLIILFFLVTISLLITSYTVCAQCSVNAAYGSGSDGMGSDMGQSFTASCDGILSQLKLISKGDQTNTTITIYEGDGLTGTALGTITEITTHNATTFIDYSIIDLSTANVSVTNGNSYTFYLSTGGWGFYHSDENHYSSGIAYYEGGEVSALDFIFIMEITPSVSNTPPAISIDNSTLSYIENNAAIQVDAAGTVSDSDGDADWNGGKLFAQITANAESADEISISDTDGDGIAITISGINILANGTDIGDLSVSGGTVIGNTILTITFDSDATNTIVQEVLQSLRYRNISNDPGTSNRTITFIATDNSSDNASDTRTIALTAVNDEPTLTATGTNPTFTEDGSAALVYSSASASTVESGQTLTSFTMTLTNVNDGSNEILNLDGTAITLTNGTSGTTAENSLSYSVSVSGTTATLSLSGGTLSTSALQTLVNAISYQNNSNTPNTSNKVVTITSLTDSGSNTGANDNIATLEIASTVTVESNGEVTSVAVPANATYSAGQNLDFTINFDENITVTTTGGTPQMNITVGVTTRQAVYQSGSGSGALLFRYTLQSGDLDVDGITVGTLALNGGLLKNSAGNDATLTLNSVGATTAVLVDAIPPSITSSIPSDDATNATLSGNIVLTFDDNMAVGIGNIAIKKMSDNTVLEQIPVDDAKITISTNQVFINPAAILSRGQEYYIEIDATALNDAAGNSFVGISGNSTLNFTAVDVLINEVVTDPQQDWSTNGFDGTINAGAISPGTDEWIELLINSNGIDLSGWTLELLDGTDVVGDLTNTGAFDDIVFSGIGSFNNTNSGDYLILGNVDGSGAMNNSITINLKDPSGAIVDAVVIGGGAGEAPSGNANDIYNESVQRFFNGLDTDVHDNDFTLGMASLGSTNTGPSVILSASTATIAEAAGISTLTAELSEISSQDVTVTLAVDGSSSAVLTDYTLSSASIVINAGSLTGTASLTATQDMVDELDESVIVNITGITNGTENGTQQETVFIIDDDDVPTVAFNATSSNASETIGSANLKVDLSAVSGITVTVDYTVTGTATDADYTLIDGTLTIAPGNENENITIASIVNDLLDENNETVIVTLTNPTNATLGTNTVHTYTINDNDATPSIAFKTTSSSGLETLVSADLQVNLSAESGLDVTVDYTVSGTATEADYTLENGTLTIEAGDESENITITSIVNDFLDENDETVILTLSNPVNATLGSNTTHTYTINDDDVTGFFFAETDGDTKVFESGTNDSFTVQLDVIPSSNVVIDLVNGNISEISMSAANLTFTPDNWNVPQVVSLNTVDDNYADGDQNVIITLSINDANSDDAFDNLADETVIVTSVDDEVPGFSLSKTTATINEDGGTDNFTVVLDCQPLTDVVLEISSGDTGEVTVSSPSLTFTTGNWDTPQTIDLTGIDDAIVDGNKNVSITIAVNDASSDNVFDAVPNQSIICTNEDNEEAGFTFRETDAYTLVKETHTTDQFSVVLDGQPASDVVLNISSGDTGEATVSSSSLTFTYDNWNISQTVIVTGVDDAIADGSQETTITISVNVPGSHDAFDSLEDKEVTVINVDDDTAGFTISQTNGGPKVNEIGIIDTMWVVLNKQPASDVVLGFESSDENEIIREHDENRFTVSNWNMPQDFRIRGMADYIVDGEVYTDLTIKVLDAYSDNAYDALPDRVISVVNIDNDIASFSLSPANLNVVEDHGTETFKITLGTAAEGDVSFNIASSDDGVVTVSHSSITISAGNTESANITLTIQDNDIADGTKDANIIVSINQAVSFDLFDDLEDENLPIQVTDDEVIELIVAELGGTSSVSETGSTDSFTAVIGAKPATDVVINISSDDIGEVTVNPTQLTFTNANWDSPQIVTLTGIDDEFTDGEQTSTITLAVDAVNSDDSFDTMPDETVSVITSDNEVANFTIVESGGSTEIDETANQDDFTVVLDERPVNDVVFDISCNATDEAIVDLSTLTFTTDNWDMPQSISITGVDDNILDGSQIAIITVSVNTASSDDRYDAVADKTVTASNGDDDVGSFTVAESEGTTVVQEPNTTDAFTVVLDIQPITDVVFTISSNDTDEATVDQSTLTFTNANWNIAQTVIVTAADDYYVDGGQASEIKISVDDANSNDGFDTVEDQTVNVVTNDDDVAGFTITQSGINTTVSEPNTQDEFLVVLDAQPLTDVVLNLKSDDSSEASLDASSITFTNANWNVAQTITVTAEDDYLVDGSQISTITLSIDKTGSDDYFDTVLDQEIDCITHDDDVAGFTIVESDGNTSVTEGGNGDSFTIVLDGQPNIDVVFDISSANTDEITVNQSSLTFTNSNWNSPQTVNLTCVNDDIDDGDQIVGITISINDDNSDDNFDMVVNQSLNSTTVDNDTAGFTLSKTTASVDEAGTTDDFTLVLDAQPLSDVVFDISSNDLGEASVSSTSITFTNANWSTPQTVSINGENDYIIDGNQSAVILVSVDALNSDDTFDLVGDQSVNCTTTDNDVADFTLTESDGNTMVDESGTTDNFTLVLDAQPYSDVVFDIGNADPGEVLISAAQLTFTNANWNIPQTVTLTGIDDSDVDNNQTTLITVSVDPMASDDNFDAVDDQTISVTITDDDEPYISFTTVSQVSLSENGSLIITAELSNPSSRMITLPFTVESGSSADGTDYSITSSPLTIAAGQTSGNIVISINADDLDEIDETVILSMGTPINAIHGSTITHTATITDDDHTPKIASTQSFSIDENSANTTSLGFVAATDANTGTTFQNWNIETGNTDGIFDIDTDSGELSVADNTNLDYEITTQYILSLTVSDGDNTSPSENVMININDLNDNTPVIMASQLFNIDENSANNTSLGTVIATDEDAGTTFYFWTITSGNDLGIFQIDPNSGEITIADNSDLDFEMNQSHTLAITVSDGDNTSLLENVMININDLNDNTPFITANQSFRIDEDSANNTSIGTVMATDGDAGTTFSSWTITSGNDLGIFQIDPNSGEITIADNTDLDFEMNQSNTLAITVSDGDNVSQSGNVMISINDLNDNTPVIAVNQSFNIDENSVNKASLGTVMATDGDAGTIFSSWTITSGNDLGIFQIDPNSGEITIADNTDLDFEINQSHMLAIIVSDGDNISSTESVFININDLNDNKPVIAVSQSFTIDENLNNENVFGTISATDTDAGTSFSNWMILNGNTNNAFAINSNSGQISVNNSEALDREITESFTLQVTVSDGIQTSEVETVVIHLNDLNDNRPMIQTDQSFSLNENPNDNAPIGIILVNDADISATTYQNWTIINNPDFSGNGNNALTIDPVSGELKVNDPEDFDCENIQSFTIKLKVSDGVDFSMEQDVTININDVNDIAPVIVPSQIFQIEENLSEGSVIGTILASDGDLTPTNLFTFTCADGNIGDAFELNEQGEIRVKTSSVLNREEIEQFELIVNASDGFHISDDETIVIKLEDLNEYAPVITANQSFAIDENPESDAIVGTVLATDEDVDPVLGNWSITGGNEEDIFKMEASSGMIMVKREIRLDYEYQSTYRLKISLDDGNQLSEEEYITIQLNDINEAPIANAGVEQMVSEGDMVTLDGSASHDPENDDLIYTWTAPIGIELSDVNAIQPSFTVPLTGESTDYIFSLVVNDSEFNSVKAYVTIKAEIATGIDDLNSVIEQVLLYPNPTKGIFNLTLGDKPVNGTLVIISNSRGQVFLQEKMFEKEKQFHPSLAPGMYLIKIIYKNKTSVQKLIIQ